MRRWQESCQSAREFAEAHGLKGWQLYEWSKARTRADTSVAKPKAFTEVRPRQGVASKGECSQVIEIEVHGHVVRVRGDVDLALLEAVLRTVARC